MRMSVDLRDLFLYEAFLYYNPLLLVVSLFYLIFHFLSTIGLYTCFFPCISIVLFCCGDADNDGLALGSKFMGLFPD